MRRRTMGMLTVFLALALGLALVGCGGKGAPAEKDTKDDATEQVIDTATTDGGTTEDEGDSGDAPDEGAADESDYLDVSGVDFSSPDIVVEDGDYEGMVSLARALANFEVEEGTIVEVTGVVGPTVMTHGIMVSDGAGTSRGTTYEVVGLADEDYPADDTPIHITGVVRRTPYGTLRIIVPKELFEVL